MQDETDRDLATMALAILASPVGAEVRKHLRAADEAVRARRLTPADGARCALRISDAAQAVLRGTCSGARS